MNLSSPTAAKLAGSLPFKPEALESVECKPTSDGSMSCQVGLTGSPNKSTLIIKNSGLKDVECHRDPTSGALVCYVEDQSGNKETVMF